MIPWSGNASRQMEMSQILLLAQINQMNGNANLRMTIIIQMVAQLINTRFVPILSTHPKFVQTTVNGCHKNRLACPVTVLLFQQSAPIMLTLCVYLMTVHKENIESVLTLWNFQINVIQATNMTQQNRIATFLV